MLQTLFASETFYLPTYFGWSASSMLSKGLTYYRQGRVAITHVDDTQAVFDVQGSQILPYSTTIMDTNNSPKGLVMTCNCPYATGSARTVCKHKVAAAYALQEYARTHHDESWKTQLSIILEKTTPAKRRVSRSLLLFSLQTYGSEWRILPYTLNAAHLPSHLAESMDVLRRHLPSQGAARATSLNYGGQPNSYLFATAVHVQLARMLAVSSYYANTLPMDIIIPRLADALFFASDGRNPFATPITVLDTIGTMSLKLDPVAEGTRLQPALTIGEVDRPLSVDAKVISLDPAWLLVDGDLLRADGDAGLLRALLGKEIIIPEAEAPDFLQQYLAPLAARTPISGGFVGDRIAVEADPAPRLYLREENKELVVEVAFTYDEYELPYSAELPVQAPRHDAARNALIAITRQPEREQELWTALNSYGLKRDGERFILRKTTTPVQFLLHHVPKLQAAGYAVFGEEALTAARVNRSRPTLSFNIASGIDWFDVDAVAHFGELQVSPRELRKAMRKRSNFVELPDGSIGMIPEEWLTRYRNLFALAEETEDGLRLSKTQMTLLDQVLGEADEVEVDEEYTLRLARLRDFSTIDEVPLPSGFVGDLRHYQHAGYNWLHFLHDYGFGGCLADDMGIGKTIQTLVFLLSLKESGHTSAASLIVMPRSLLINWAREAERFTPGLRVHIHADSDRLTDARIFDDYDVVVTTYGIMLRDLDMLRKYQFHYVVLDESQAVKNPHAQTARATRMVCCDHRLALTGTPVENSTDELWSLFAFLNPGMLGSLDFFHDTFTAPIQRNQDEAAAHLLRAMVFPFILRRTKEQVTPELPPRTDRILYCEMDVAQTKAYNRWRDKYRAQLLGLIDDGGIQNARMKVLEGLLRLRQLSNHPRLVEPTFKGESAKFEMLVETLETLRAEGHKALVFSQFTQMLKLVREEMDNRRIPYLYLDGQTKDRQERVDQFQQDPAVPFFLISLKAGGTGLNLTAADYVIHIDPWWNPAVERQATDRTHRIGQENPVMVYKLIAKDTVEEKILLLQERKQALVDQLISTESTFMKSLTREDVAVLFE